MQNNWLFLTILAGISASIFNTFLRRALRHGQDSTAYAWWFEFIRLCFFGLLIPFFPYFVFSWSHLALLIVLGLFEFVAVYLYMKMHGSNELSLSTIVMQLRSVYVPLFAFLAFGEHLTSTQWFGVALVVTGAVIVTRPKSWKVDRALSYAILASLFTAISSVTIKAASNIASIPVVTFAFSLPSVLLFPLLMKNPLTRLRASAQHVWRHNLPASAANIITMFALVAALHAGSAGRTSGIFQGVSMLAVVFGIVFFGEQDHKAEKVCAAALTVLGIVVLV